VTKIDVYKEVYLFFDLEQENYYTYLIIKYTNTSNIVFTAVSIYYLFVLYNLYASFV